MCIYQVKHVKVCAKCSHEGKCLKGVKMDKCDCYVDSCSRCEEDCDCDCNCDCKDC